MVLRRVVQLAATALTNAWWLFPWSNTGLYTGRLKTVCAPGLNCYSCPAAVAACPIGSLQNFMATLRPTMESGGFQPGFYVLGWLGMLGALSGRMPCGWLCPFGFFQELMHKIPAPRLRIPKVLSYLKYVILALFVIILPALVTDVFGYGQTWYCKFICPAGTLEAGLPLLALKPGLRESLGWLFVNKLAILALFLVWMVFSRRPFCRVACPLGAFYGLFNKISVLRMVHHEDKCVHCGACLRDCPMDVDFSRTPNSPDCIRCLKCMQHSCRYGAISFELAGVPARREAKPAPDQPA